MKLQKVLYYLSPAVCALELAALLVVYFPAIAGNNNTVNIICLLIMPLVTYLPSLLWLISMGKPPEKKMLILTLAGLVLTVVCVVMTLLDFGFLTIVFHSIPLLLIGLLIYWQLYYAKKIRK